ncbi:cell division protein FtsA [Roseivirga pacifica]|jgi:cell division protein FtsA|uniref:cell division protein FtsA n=1 Tax=Roseivirga pacifica TaxID=1267423 RepID=UPI0020940FE5|nr:cell division protein FtsA [Roseivirga pacifica]MCO6358267.1 cell division protein FtsA [Roseivirga pacifica]MCO6366269.1 cell division protein FtsA [Roseivirga pacifica]MCO6369180.1 cell division protein FtsA [Roseivirga pacifica]MCO6373998.1 cell division protein FtsA [Roseivirga pacifica]MCO6378374.1 cell division protein FtsA [Roseivirga pacifica]
MQDNKIVVGLDIGTTKICAIVGTKNEYGKLEVLGMGKAVSDGVIRGIVTNIDKTILAIEKAIAEASEQSGIEINVVNVGIAGQHIKSSIHHGSITRDRIDDEITVEDLNRLSNDVHKIVMPPGCEIIHVMPQDYIVDYEDGIKDPVGMSGVKLEADFHVITAQTNAIRNINKCVKRGGLEIENLILEPLASSMSVLSDEEKEAGVCLVDIGGGTTDVAIFHDGIIRHTAVIPFGGNIITTDIKEGLKVMQNQAELLKTRFGRAIAEEANPNEIVSIPGLRNRPPKEISIRNLAHIIEARMEEIIELVHAEIITSGYSSKMAGGIVITGGGSQLAGIQQLFEYMTGMESRIGYPNEHLGKSKIEAIKSPMYATTVGLVLSGFRAIDERDNRYVESKTANMTRREAKSVKKGSEFFTKLIDKTKGLLMDDFHDKGEY